MNADGNQKRKKMDTKVDLVKTMRRELHILAASDLSTLVGRHAGKRVTPVDQEPGALRDLPVVAVGSPDFITALSHPSLCRYLLKMNEMIIYDLNCVFNPRCEE